MEPSKLMYVLIYALDIKSNKRERDKERERQRETKKESDRETKRERETVRERENKETDRYSHSKCVPVPGVPGGKETVEAGPEHPQDHRP